MVTSLEALEAGRVALADAERTVTFGQLDERANRLINALTELGVGPEQRLAVLTGNRAEFFEIAVAAGHSGHVYVPVSWHLTVEEVAYVLTDADVQCFFVDHKLLGVGAQAAADAGLPPDRVIVIGGDAGPFRAYEELLATVTAEPPADEAVGRPMFYTSGTTGRPKGVRPSGGAASSAPAWAVVGPLLATALQMPVGGVQLLCGPAYHTAQWSWTVPILFAGNTIVMRDSPSAEEILRLIDEWEVTGLHLVPTQMLRLVRVETDVRARFDGSSLAAVWHGAAPCPQEVKRELIEWWGPIVWEYYGGTEGGVLTRVSPTDWLAHPGTVGTVAPGYEVKVLDEAGDVQPAGVPGQIWFRQLSGARFEYHNAPEKTEASRLGDLATLGDIGYFDDDGFLYLSDRAIDLIISGGVNIYPAEIEQCLLTHPFVVDAAVFGVPDTEFGEQVRAAVEVIAGAPTGDELHRTLDAHVRSHLAGLKAPRVYEVLEALPRLASGKVLKRELRSGFLAEVP